MTFDARAILEELLALDTSLRGRETELLPVLEELLKHRPDAQPDPAFVQRLRQLLRERALTLTHRRQPFAFLPSLAFALTGVFVGIVIAVPSVSVFLRQDAAPPALPSAPAAATETMEAPEAPKELRATGENVIGGSAPAQAPTELFLLEGALPPLPQGTVAVLTRKKAPAPSDSFLRMERQPALQKSVPASGSGVAAKDARGDAPAADEDSAQAYRTVEVKAVSDPARIRAFLEAYIGGRADAFGTVRLGTPAFILAPEEGGGEERIVPALLFPVLNAGDLPAFPHDTIAVPLAEDALERAMEQMGR